MQSTVIVPPLLLLLSFSAFVPRSQGQQQEEQWGLGGDSSRGEVERLLRFTQNQDLVRNLGSRYYQVIYPIQVRQRDAMSGLSTRDASIPPTEGGDGQVRRA